MGISIFVSIWINDVSSEEVRVHFMDEPLGLLKSNPAVSSVELYTPEPGDVPVMDDIPRPELIVQINLESKEQALGLAESEEFQKLFLDKNMFSSPIDKLNMEILESVHFDLPERETPPVRSAPLSFVVRYYGPVENAADFQDFYMKNHPPILAKFPKIRNVLCYLPVDGNSGEITDQSLVIGNEVVFDDLESFKDALASEVLQEAKADGEQFASYGYSSHHAMHREFVYER